MTPSTNTLSQSADTAEAPSPAHPVAPAFPRLHRILGAVAVAITVAVAIASWARLFIGVDLTDESFYLALPLRFALGDVPLRDEQNLAQLGGFLLTPLVSLWLWLQGGTDFLVLFMRHMHLLFTVLVGAVVYGASRSMLGRGHALLTASLCVAFVPFNIHGLGYNTLGSGCLAMGLFLAFKAAGRGGPARWVAAGACQAIAALVYPTLVIAIPTFAMFALATLDRPTRKAAWKPYLLGLMLVGLLPTFMVLRAGWSSLPEILLYLSTFDAQAGGGSKFVSIATDLWRHTPGKWVLSAAAVASVILRLAPRAVAVPILALLPLALGIFCRQPNGTASLYVVTAVAALAPFVRPFTKRQDGQAHLLMRLVWWPSAISAVVTSWSSSNGAVNASLGAFPAALVTLILMQDALAARCRAPALLRELRQVVAVAAPALVLWALLAGGYADVYGERIRTHLLTWPVVSGPFRGIFTSQQHRDQLAEFDRSILPHLRPSDRPFVFDGTPAAYLLLGLRPATNSVWSAPAFTRPSRVPVLRYWERQGKPSVVFMTSPAPKPDDSVMKALAASGYQPVAEVELGTLLRRPDTTPQPEAAR